MLKIYICQHLAVALTLPNSVIFHNSLHGKHFILNVIHIKTIPMNTWRNAHIFLEAGAAMHEPEEMEKHSEGDGNRN